MVALVRRSLCLAAWLSLAAGEAWAAGTVTLPFFDGFDSGLSPWSLVRVSGANSVTTSVRAAASGSQGLETRFAGNPSYEEAAPVLNFAAVSSIFVRFKLFLPVGTNASLQPGDFLRLVRIADGET